MRFCNMHEYFASYNVIEIILARMSNPEFVVLKCSSHFESRAQPNSSIFKFRILSSSSFFFCMTLIPMNGQTRGEQKLEPFLTTCWEKISSDSLSEGQHVVFCGSRTVAFTNKIATWPWLFY